MMNDTEYDWGVASVSVTVMVTRNRPSEARDRQSRIGRADLLAAKLPATDADAAADRDAAKAALNARLKLNDTAQRAQILAQEELPADPTDPAAAAMRARIRERYGELHAERQQIQAQIDALDTTEPRAADPALLDQLPYAGDILPGLPPALKARLFQIFDMEVLWNKPGQQATVYAEITEATLKALPEILNPHRDGYDDTADHNPPETPVVGDLDTSPIGGLMTHDQDASRVRASFRAVSARGWGVGVDLGEGADVQVHG